MNIYMTAQILFKIKKLQAPAEFKKIARNKPDALKCSLFRDLPLFYVYLYT